jgi:hypothetical protein
LFRFLSRIRLKNALAPPCLGPETVSSSPGCMDRCAATCWCQQGCAYIMLTSNLGFQCWHLSQRRSSKPQPFCFYPTRQFSMEQFELAPKSRPQGYDSVPQLDRNPSPPSTPPSAPVYTQSPATLRHPSQSSISTLKHGENADFKTLRIKLPPKSYSQGSPRRRVWKHIRDAAIVLVTIGSTLSVFLVTALIYGTPEPDASATTACDDLSLSEYASQDYDLSEVLNVNVAFGDFSFTLAKFIDLVWDIFISRCGQLLLGWITYRIYTGIMLWIMETEQVPYEFFKTISFSSAKILTLQAIWQTLFTKLMFRRKLLLAWMSLSILWYVKHYPCLHTYPGAKVLGSPLRGLGSSMLEVFL